jgi:hypothetical protein
MNPGITSTGLFWTMAVPEDSVEVDFEKGALNSESSTPRSRTTAIF